MTVTTQAKQIKAWAAKHDAIMTEGEREAQHRIDQVRLRQMAFRVKEAYPKLNGSDVEAVAFALLELFDEGKKPTLSDLRETLTRHKSEEYADAVIAAITA